MLSGLDLGGFSEEGAGWPVCGRHAPYTDDGQLYTCQLGFRKMSVRLATLQGVPSGSSCPSDWDVTAGKEAAHCVPPWQKTKHWLKRNLKVVEKTTNPMLEAKHCSS